MDAAQFGQFLRALQNSGNKRKLPEYTSGDPVAWLEWRVTYNNIRELNGWNDDAVCVAQIKGAMGGYAAVAVQGIDNATPGGLLDAYEARFCTAAASVQARQQFLAAKQEPTESIVAWHTRVRTLYRRADAAADLEGTKELIDRFVFGLHHPVVMERTLDTAPANMTDALREAASKAATIACVAEHTGKKPGAGLYAMAGPSTGGDAAAAVTNKKCWNCDEVGHLSRDCPQPKRGKGRGSNKGKGRGSNKGKGGGQGGRRLTINALADLLSKVELVEDEEDATPAPEGSGN